MLIALVVIAAVAALVLALQSVGAAEPVYRIKSDGAVWFVALRGVDGAKLAPGVRTLWSSRADFALIGASDAYWSQFMIVTGPGTTPLTDEAFEDAYVARLRVFTPPKIALGIVRTLIALGVLSRPSTENVATDAQSLGFRPDVMPSASAIARLLEQPASYSPAMVNLLKYYETAKYARGGSGRAAYARYGQVAMRTVFRTGGHLLFYGAVVEVVRAAKAGPTVGAWDDVAAMRYPNPPAILSMEHVPEYRAALQHRDAGLERTVVIASTPD